MIRWQGRLQGCHRPGTVNTADKVVRTFQKDPLQGILGRASCVFAFFLWDTTVNSLFCDQCSVLSKNYIWRNECQQMFCIPLQTVNWTTVPEVLPIISQGYFHVLFFFFSDWMSDWSVLRFRMNPINFLQAKTVYFSWIAATAVCESKNKQIKAKPLCN